MLAKKNSFDKSSPDTNWDDGDERTLGSEWKDANENCGWLLHILRTRPRDESQDGAGAPPARTCQVTLGRSFRDSEPPFPHLPLAATSPQSPFLIEKVKGHGVCRGQIGTLQEPGRWSDVSLPQVLVTGSLCHWGRPQCSPDFATQQEAFLQAVFQGSFYRISRDPQIAKKILKNKVGGLTLVSGFKTYYKVQ